MGRRKQGVPRKADGQQDPTQAQLPASEENEGEGQFEVSKPVAHPTTTSTTY